MKEHIIPAMSIAESFLFDLAQHRYPAMPHYYRKMVRNPATITRQEWLDATEPKETIAALQPYAAELESPDLAAITRVGFDDNSYVLRRHYTPQDQPSYYVWETDPPSSSTGNPRKVSSSF